MFSPSPKLSFLLARYYRPEETQHRFISPGNPNSPVVIHFPGSQKNSLLLHAMIETMDNLPSCRIEQPADIHIIQLNNYATSDKTTNPGEYFLTKAELRYTALGKNRSSRQWKNSEKLILLFEALSELPMTDTEQYFLFFDSSDALLIAHPKPLISALKEYQCRVLFGMDSIIYNGYSLPRNLLKTPDYMQGYRKDNYRFLNSGMIFGCVTTMKKILSFLLERKSIGHHFPHLSDQHYYHTARFEFPNEIAVDYKKKYLLNVFGFRSFFERFQS